MERTYRSHRRLATASRVLAVAALIGWPAFVLMASCGTGGGTCSRPASLAAGLTAGAVFAFFLWALGRPVVLASDAGVVMRGYLRTFTFPWERVERFELRPHDTWTTLRLTDGSLHLVVALQAELPVWATRGTPRALGMVEELNEMVAAHRGPAPTEPARSPARPARSYGLLVALPVSCGVGTGWVVAVSRGWPAGVLLGLLWLVPVAVNLTVVRRAMDRAGGYDLPA